MCFFPQDDRAVSDMTLSLDALLLALALLIKSFNFELLKICICKHTLFLKGALLCQFPVTLK